MRRLRFRFSIVLPMAVVAVVALDLAVIRTLLRYRPGSNQFLYLVPTVGATWIPFATLALGFLPMASLLVLSAIHHLPKIRRTRTVSGFWLGFETFGWFSVFLFMTGSSLSPAAIQTYLIMIGGPVLSLMLGVAGNEAPRWLVDGVGLATSAFFLVLPELLLATAGGWLVNRAQVGMASGQVAVETSSSPRASRDPVDP